MFEIPLDHELTCLRCGWVPKEKTVDPNTLCPSCKTDLTLIYINPEDFCRECETKIAARQLGGFLGLEMFSVTDDRVGELTWLIPSGYEQADKNVVIPLDAPTTAKYLRVNITEPRHYDHVNPEHPGLVAEFRISDGKKVQPVYVLIDGSHRAARCLQDKLGFKVYLLSHAQSERCRMG